MVNGMPLVYSGQEAGLNRSLAFFDKDVIQWKDHPFSEIYKKLFALKHKNQALWNGERGGEMIRIFNNQPDRVISFSREKNGDKVITNGGIYGTIVGLEGDAIQLRIADQVKIKISRSAIAPMANRVFMAIWQGARSRSSGSPQNSPVSTST